MPELTRQKITFGEMHAAGVRGLLIYCSGYKCSHGTAISGVRWPDDVRLSDVEVHLRACGRKGADVRPDFRLGRSGLTHDDFRTIHVGPDQAAGSSRGMAEPNVRKIRGKSPGKLGNR
jgi:hypothetical protein